MNVGFPVYQGDFIVVTPLIGDRPGLVPDKGIQPEHVEMTYFLINTFRYPAKFPFIKILNTLRLIHISGITVFKQFSV
jgi:hypothetical protein